MFSPCGSWWLAVRYSDEAWDSDWSGQSTERLFTRQHSSPWETGMTRTSNCPASHHKGLIIAPPLKRCLFRSVTRRCYCFVGAFLSGGIVVTRTLKSWCIGWAAVQPSGEPALGSPHFKELPWQPAAFCGDPQKFGFNTCSSANALVFWLIWSNLINKHKNSTINRRVLFIVISLFMLPTCFKRETWTLQ